MPHAYVKCSVEMVVSTRQHSGKLSGQGDTVQLTPNIATMMRRFQMSAFSACSALVSHQEKMSDGS